VRVAAKSSEQSFENAMPVVEEEKGVEPVIQNNQMIAQFEQSVPDKPGVGRLERIEQTQKKMESTRKWSYMQK